MASVRTDAGPGPLDQPTGHPPQDPYAALNATTDPAAADATATGLATFGQPMDIADHHQPSFATAETVCSTTTSGLMTEASEPGVPTSGIETAGPATTAPASPATARTPAPLPDPAFELTGRRVLLIVSGGIAAYKSLELIRLLTGRGCAVRCVLTESGARFVTPLSLQALSGETVHTTLWSLTDESEMGHIALSRSADLLVVCPASADILARMANGLADDLATTLLLATDTPVLVAPAMNVRMWEHPATRANMTTLRDRGIHVVGPDEGVMACNEFGAGRLAEPPAILNAIAALLSPARTQRDLAGRHALVTAGPTYEPIDPVRYIANRSSGRQGYAIAAALAGRGARVTLVSGPTVLPRPPGVTFVAVETACEMLAACQDAGRSDIAVMTAAVADWRAATPASSKLKKQPGQAPPPLALALNPDILAILSQAGPARPSLVVGFAAETDTLIENAVAKRLRKGCDWIVANDVRTDTGIIGGTHNEVQLITGEGIEAWPRLDKQEVADRLAARIAHYFVPGAAP